MIGSAHVFGLSTGGAKPDSLPSDLLFPPGSAANEKRHSPRTEIRSEVVPCR